jgi:drug/metabolite transporter (DMT)-like permease
MALMLALGSGLTFGVADFVGGLAARRASATTVTLLAQAVGLAVLLPLLGLLPGTPSVAAFVGGAFAGIAGALGLLAYLRALALGPMGVVAPLAAVVGVMVPVVAGFVAGERLSWPAAIGIGLGLAAIGVVATGSRRRTDEHAAGTTGALLALVAGATFGAFFVLLDLTPAASGMWPLVGARASSLTLLAILAATTGGGWPPRRTMPMVAASGALDMLANILFLLATRAGLLTISALLASLYPVVVVLLARHLLAERLRGPQVLAVGFALAAIAIITVG